MKKEAIIRQLTNSLVKSKPRKNRVTTQDITSTLVTAALNGAFVNESCKSSGKVSKSQVIYRKLEGNTIEIIKECFQKHTLRFLKALKIFSRNRSFIISFDTTKEAFYGEIEKAEDRLYLHSGSIADGSKYYYEFLTVAITCNNGIRYILDGIICPRGYYKEDYIYEMTNFIKKHLPIELILFDRGFTSWGIVYKLRKLKVPYLVFWEKHGEWYKEHFDELKDGEFKKLSRSEKYRRDKDYNKVNSDFIIIKQLEYDGKKYNWIFATNVNLKSAEAYVKRYKKRWGIETIYRVTDKIRAYTTSTKSLLRYFLFMFTCFVYNIWKFFQMFLGEGFSLSNCKTNMIIFMAKRGIIYPKHYDQFETIAEAML